MAATRTAPTWALVLLALLPVGRGHRGLRPGGIMLSPCDREPWSTYGYCDHTLPEETRLEDLMQRMTLQDKIDAMDGWLLLRLRGCCGALAGIERAAARPAFRCACCAATPTACSSHGRTLYAVPC